MVLYFKFLKFSTNMTAVVWFCYTPKCNFFKSLTILSSKSVLKNSV